MMVSRRAALALLLGGSCASIWAETHPVSPMNRYERIVCLVPMIGRGTLDDPRRPLFAPVAAQTQKATRTGIFAYTYQLTDDKQFAIVEFAFADHQSLLSVLKNSQVLKAFERRASKAADIQAFFQQYKKDFDVNRFGMVIQ